LESPNIIVSNKRALSISVISNSPKLGSEWEVAATKPQKRGCLNKSLVAYLVLKSIGGDFNIANISSLIHYLHFVFDLI